MSADFELEFAASGRSERLARFIGALTQILGHRDRHRPFEDYCRALMLSGDRKSVEPLASRLRPATKDATHQALLHFVGQASWDNTAVLQGIARQVVPALERHGKIRTWIIDDTGMPKKGSASVGVAHQYCGNLGKQANCQVAVSLSIANDFGSLPLRYRLYLPTEWADDMSRRTQTKVPEEVRFATKIEIALEHLRSACESGIARGTVVADAAYGHASEFRAEVAKLGLRYCVAIQKNTTVWTPDNLPKPPTPRKPHELGRPRTRHRRTSEQMPQSVEEVARALPSSAFRRVRWREGTKEILESRFACVPVRMASRFDARFNDEELLLVEWPAHESSPRKYWLANYPVKTPKKMLVEIAQSRWRIERDYQELKDELGLDHYEGRGWRGFHHHATLCIAAYGFLMMEKSAAVAGDFSPSRVIRRQLAAELEREYPPPAPSDLPRGAGRARRAAHAHVDHVHAHGDCANDRDGA